MYPNSTCMSDIMILAQAVLQVFCWQDCFIIQNAREELIQQYSVQNLPKVNQVIYTLDIVCEPNRVEKGA